jgi:hypothetical protein
MITMLIFAISLGVLAFIVASFEEDLWMALFAGVVMVAVSYPALLGIRWAIQEHQTSKCEERAEGFGLEAVWSFRHDCRYILPTGHVITEGRIRITTDGEILVREED